MKNSKNKGLLKKAIAVILGISMAFGALMLPNNTFRSEFSTASAYTTVIDGCEYKYEINEDRGIKMLRITDIILNGDTDTVKIPSTLSVNGVDYPVYETYTGILENDQQVKKVIFPDTVKVIGLSNLAGSSVENIELPDGLEELGIAFAARCPNLRSVKYNGTGIKEGRMGYNVFKDSEMSYLLNEKGAFCLGNWLMRYIPDDTVTSVKIADLSSGDIKIENMASTAFYYNASVTTVDLEGIKNIDSGNFNSVQNLETVLNSEDVECVAENTFHYTYWYSRAREGNLIRLGKTILYYKTDDSVLDLTSGKFAGTKKVAEKALIDCKNLDTIFCNSDCIFDARCFYEANELHKEDSFRTDPIPENPVYKIKDVYLDGKKLTNKVLMSDTAAYEWLKNNRRTFKNSALTKALVEEKTKELFDQLDITYYGPNNDKAGTLTPTEEFYIRLKIHNYLSIYDYDHGNTYGGFQGAFLLGGKVQCDGYAEMTHYFLDSAGVASKTNYSDPTDPNSFGVHFWNLTKIGDEWFASDDGWNAQNNNHTFGWFLNSYSAFNTSEFHTLMYTYDSIHFYTDTLNTEEISMNRFYGDIDGDDKRKQDDAKLLWNYIKGTSSDIDKKRADMNFDGKVDVTDAVLLDRIVYGTAIDKNNVPIDGLAPGVQVAFLNGTDYDNIQYAWTERGGYITLPELDIEAPEGKKLSYDVGMVGQKVRITTPYQVIKVKWIDADTPDYSEPDNSSKTNPGSKTDPGSKPNSGSNNDSSSKPDKKEGKLGDVNNDGTIDIEDAVAVIQHINGLTPLTADEETRADVSKDRNIDIDDAVMIISYINGNSTF